MCLDRYSHEQPSGSLDWQISEASLVVRVFEGPVVISITHSEPLSCGLVHPLQHILQPLESQGSPGSSHC